MLKQALKAHMSRFNRCILVNAVPQRRNYNTVIERQSEMHLIGMDTTCVVNLIETLHLDYGLSMPQSLIFLQVCSRLV